MEQRIDTFTRLLSTMPTGHLLDLAAGHGKFSVAAHKLGWKVTAVDARTKRFPMTRGIEWIESDVREFPIDDRYTCISVLGLLYHLELPDQLDLMRRCAGTPTIVDTHVSLAPDRVIDGYEGHIFDELAGRTPKQHRWSGTASWRNYESFWATEESLLKMFRDCGFDDVWALTPRYSPDRTFYLCL